MSPHMLKANEAETPGGEALDEAIQGGGEGEVELVDDVDEGHQRVGTGSYTAYAVDVSLPDGDGYRFVAGLRAAGHDEPVLLLGAPHGLLAVVWGPDCDLQSNALDVHIGHLRKKLECAGPDGVIETIRGRGYMLRLSDAAEPEVA